MGACRESVGRHIPSSSRPQAMYGSCALAKLGAEGKVRARSVASCSWDPTEFLCCQLMGQDMGMANGPRELFLPALSCTLLSHSASAVSSLEECKRLSLLHPYASLGIL